MPRVQLIDQDVALDRMGLLPNRADFPEGPDGEKAFKRRLYRERAKLAGVITPIQNLKRA